jgi:Flp pilus assembly protein TadG
MRLRSRLRRRRIAGERGAALIEFAIVTPILILLAFATAETGLAWVSNNKVEGVTSQAARVASSAGTSSTADLSTLVAIRASLPADELANLQRVVIFKSTTTDGAVPGGTACIPAVEIGANTGLAGTCNSYSGAFVRTVTMSSTLPTAAANNWPPSLRKNALADPPDYIGVWLRTTHTNRTRALHGDFTITKSSVFRIQPDFSS